MDDAPQRKTGPAPTRRGYEAFDVVSALQKAIRRSDLDAALYWSTELSLSGYAAWAWKRVKIICVEDVGPAAPGVAADVHALHSWWKESGDRSSGGMYLAHAVLLLANAPKSRVACWGVIYHGSDHVERRQVPDEAVDQHTSRGRQMGRGDQHFLDGGPSTLIQPEPGDLERLEAEHRENFRRLVAKDPSLPVNPCARANVVTGETDHIQYGSVREPEQMALGDDREAR